MSPGEILYANQTICVFSHLVLSILRFFFFSQTVCCGVLRVGSVVVGHGVRFLEKVMGGEKVTGNGKLDWCKKGRLIAGDLSHGVGECIVLFAIVSNCLVILMDTTPGMADSFDE
ncbi:hypothetical protein J3E68DRAFT_233377 [Trichoderma sp. SZMC 28012]